MTTHNIQSTAEGLATQARELAVQADSLVQMTAEIAAQNTTVSGELPFLFLFTAFVLACIIGYYVVWSVTPALHSPLMGVTNAISSVIIVGALVAAGPADMNLSKVFGFIAVLLASVNIFGGFVVTNRMLGMFHKKDNKTSRPSK